MLPSINENHWFLLPGGGLPVYRKCFILQQFAYTPPNRPHQPFPYFPKPKPGGGVYLWAPDLAHRPCAWPLWPCGGPVAQWDAMEQDFVYGILWDFSRHYFRNYWYEVGTEFDDCGTKFVEISTKYNPEVIKYRP